MGSMPYRHVLNLTVIGLLSVMLMIIQPVCATASITATESVPDWVFSPGTNTKLTDLRLTVTTDNAPWTVEVSDAYGGGKSASFAGRLVEYNISTSTWINSGNVISTNMTVNGENSTLLNIEGFPVTLGPTGNVIQRGHNRVTSQELAINLTQPITYNDPYLSNGDVYRVVLTFVLYQL